MTALRLALALFSVYIASGCAARSAPAPGPELLIRPNLPDDARLCVPRQTFRNEGIACITVGELRALLRNRRSS